jgi:hypothetical protein
MAPVFVIATLTLGVFFWASAGYLAACAVGLGLVTAVPAWTVARLLFALRPKRWVGALLFALVGAASAIAAFGLISLAGNGQFAPLTALGPAGGRGVMVLIGYAAICSCLGWLTVYVHRAADVYLDALGGHTFEEIARVIDTTSGK